METFLFYGTGKLSSANINALLSDLLDSFDGRVKFEIPITEKLFTESMEYVVRFALTRNVPTTVLIDPSTRQNQMRAEVVELFSSRKLTKDLPAEIIQRLSDGTRTLILFWNDADPASREILEKAAKLGDHPKILDITHGLDEILFDTSWMRVHSA